MGSRLHAGMSRIPAPETPKETPEIEYVKWLAQMQTDLAQSHNGVLLQGARPAPLGGVDAGTGTVRLTGSAGRLVGWSVRETGGVNGAVIRLHDSRDTSGTVIAVISVNAGQAQTIWLDAGVSFVDALAAELVTGANLSTAIEGSVYLGAAT